MVSMQLAAVLLAVSGVGDATLLDFQAQWCGPCKSMEPTMAQLAAAGYPIRKVDVDREPELAARFNVHSYPSFVLVVNGQEVDRTVGATDAGTIQQMFSRAGITPASATVTRGQSPDPPLRRISMPRLRNRGGLFGGQPAQTAKTDAPADPFAGQTPRSQAPAGAATAADLLETAARLVVEDASGFSYGSGTVIDSRSGEALVLTCGHIFRDSGGKGKITVDLFGSNPQKLQGQLVSYDLTRDIGLVAIRSATPIRAARVAPKGHVVARGDKVISIGCNNGANPTVEQTQVTAVDKFGPPANVEIAGQPVQGRSGGGLFSSEGLVIGVCNCADPADNEGLFAAAETIQAELDKAGLTALYQPQVKGPAGRALASTSSATRGTAAMPAQMPADVEERPLAAAVPTDMRVASSAKSDGGKQLSGRDGARLADAIGQAPEAEVICVLRSRDGKTKSEVIVLDRASSTFLEQLAAERQAQDGRQLTSLEVPRGSNAVR